MSNRVIIMRGFPGSGKSRYVKKLIKELRGTGVTKVHGDVVCSADFFWIDSCGCYRYNPVLAPMAHIRCFYQFTEALNRKMPTVIVDNTNIHCHEYTPYFMAATIAGYEITIVTVKTPLEACMLQQIHNVPLKTMQLMEQEFEETLSHHKKYEIIVEKGKIANATSNN